MKLKSGILALLVLGTSQAMLQAAAVDATVASVTGTAYVTDSSGKSKKIAKGDLIPAGSSIHTSGDCSVGLQLLPGATTVVAPATDIMLSNLDYSQTSSGSKVRKINIKLRKGTLFSSLAKHDGNSDFRISTPLGVAAARGTDWAVSFSATTGITVSTVDGVVTLTFPNGTSVQVPGGQETTSTDGTLTTVTSTTLTQDQIDVIVTAIEDAGFALSNGGTNGGGSDTGSNFENNSGSSNPANVVSPNQP